MKTHYSLVPAILICALLALFLTLAVPGIARTAKDQSIATPSLDSVIRDCAELRKKYNELKKGTEDSSQRISWLSRTSPPVGTVVSFGGKWPPPKGEGGTWTEDELGWVLCDGRPLAGNAFAELRAVLGKESLPDYRGCFLRGIDVSVDGKTTGRDKNGTRIVGNEQGYSTAMPVSKKFVTSDTGGHSHVLNLPIAKVSTLGQGRNVAGTVYGRESDGNNGSTADAGSHHHEITEGGDTETRPINIAIYLIMKFK